MTKKELFEGWNERMFMDDPAAIAAYCRGTLAGGVRAHRAGGGRGLPRLFSV